MYRKLLLECLATYTVSMSTICTWYYLFGRRYITIDNKKIKYT